MLSFVLDYDYIDITFAKGFGGNEKYLFGADCGRYSVWLPQ